jgi:hypothetical protein
MSSSNATLDGISAGTAGAALVVNAAIDALSPNALFGRRASQCVGLTWGWYGGVANVSGVPTIIANGTRVLSPNTTTYAYADGSATVQFTTSTPTGWPGPLSGAFSGFLALYQIVTGANTVTSYTDYRLGAVSAGTAGPAGAAGAVWRTGSGVPSNGLGANGDFYIDTATGNVYSKASSVYTLQLNIQGPAWSPTLSTVAYSASLTLDHSAKTDYDVTLTGPLALTFSNGVDRKTVTVCFRQDATGGRILTLGAGIGLSTDLPSIVLSSGASKVDYIGFKYNSTSGLYHVMSFIRGFS